MKKHRQNIEKEEHIVLKGTVTECLPGTKFKVKLDDYDKIVNCSLAGKLRMNKITITKEDKVEVELSPYDINAGIITWRFS